jgi:branched-subunit amino acid transport protein
VLEKPVVRRIAALLPVALLAALVGVQTFGHGQAVTVDARLAGLAAAITALLLRAPFLVVVLAAAATTALLRLAF